MTIKDRGKCEICKWWVAFDDAESVEERQYGHCRCKPPVVVESDEPQDYGINYVNIATVWPESRKDEFCGKFTNKWE